MTGFLTLLTLMAAVQAKDVSASFLFVAKLNGHHWKLLGSTTTNRHVVSPVHLATVSGFGHLDFGPTHARRGTHYLMIIDVLNLVWVVVVAPIGIRITNLCRLSFR